MKDNEICGLCSDFGMCLPVCHPCSNITEAGCKEIREHEKQDGEQE